MDELGEKSIVYEVEQNYLIDYLTFSISSNAKYSINELFEFRRATEDSERELYDLFNILYQDYKLYKLFSILKIEMEDFRFVQSSKGFAFALTNDYYYLAFEHSSLNSWGKHSNFIELSGKGCRYFESQGGDWKELIDYLFDEFLEFNCTRLDLAMDDFTNYFTFEELEKKFRRLEFVCSARTYNVNLGFNNNGDLGKTLYAGTTTSTQQLCIYDKKLEREAQGLEVDVSHWIRYEFRLRQGFAKSALKELKETTNSLPVFITERIGGFLDFKVPDKSRMHNCDTWPKWKRFLKHAEKHKVSNQYIIEQSIVRKKTWMKRSLGKFLSTLYCSDKVDFIRQLKKLMDDSFAELDKSHLSLINSYLKDNGEMPLTLEEIRKNVVAFPVDTTMQETYFADGDIIEMFDKSIFIYTNGKIFSKDNPDIFYDSDDWRNPNYMDSDKIRGLNVYQIERLGNIFYKSNMSYEMMMQTIDVNRKHTTRINKIKGVK